MKVEKIKIVEKRGNTTLFEKKKVSISMFRDDLMVSFLKQSDGTSDFHLVNSENNGNQNQTAKRQ